MSMTTSAKLYKVPTQRQRISDSQRAKLLEFMKANPYFAKHLIGEGPQGKENGKKMWKAVADMLNAMGGAKKNEDGWKQTWSDIKARVKKQAVVVMNNAVATGNGSHNGEGPETTEAPKLGRNFLTAEEEQIYALCGKRDWIGSTKEEELGVYPLPISAETNSNAIVTVITSSNDVPRVVEQPSVFTMTVDEWLKRLDACNGPITSGISESCDIDQSVMELSNQAARPPSNNDESTRPPVSVSVEAEVSTPKKYKKNKFK